MVGLSYLARYSNFLPQLDWHSLPTLGEGNTPLVRSTVLGPRLGLDNLYFKLESCNPTGSYKDRFIACELVLQKSRGYHTVLATTSGNTGASLAAYSARLKMRCYIFVLEKAPNEKLLQMASHGATIFRVKGFGIDSTTTESVFDVLSRLQERGRGRRVVSAYAMNPEGMEGVKTIAHEICDQLGSLPNHCFVPVGGGGLYTAIARGFRDMMKGDCFTQVHVVQPKLNDTIVSPLRQGLESARSSNTTTAISGLAVPVDIDGTRAIAAARICGGTGYLPTDKDIWSAQREMAEEEGLFVEPAGATAFAGLKLAVDERRVKPDDTVVCIVSGHGFKDSSNFEKATDAISLIELGEIPDHVH